MTRKSRVAINGFGRIGRLTFRNLIQNEEVEVVAINDLADIEMLAHLLMYDSVHGKLPVGVSVTDQGLLVDGQSIKVYNEANPANLPWGELGIDAVIEATGCFVTKDSAGQHITAGAGKVIISAPAKDEVKTIVLGVNEKTLTSSDQIISNASCTTNCLAPMVKVLDEAFGLEKGFISTIHAYTADQRLQDSPHKDFRRARAAALSIIPTSTGAAVSVAKVIPSMKGKLDGIAMRVPIPNGSVTDFTAVLKTETTSAMVNEAFRKASENELKGILEYSTAPLVSVDIVGNAHSCILDAPLTSVNEKLVKIVGWYDNEYGYSSRTAELVQLVANL